MGKELVVNPDRSHDGKAMSLLSEQQRAFVLRMMELGPTKDVAAKAAEDVGFSKWNGYKLMRDDKIIRAIHEESAKQLAGAVVIGVKRLIEIAQDENHRDSYKAAKELAAMNGFSAEQRIVVEHVSTDTREQIRQIRAMAIELGLNPEQLIKSAGIVDAEFTDVEDRDE